MYIHRTTLDWLRDMGFVKHFLNDIISGGPHPPDKNEIYKLKPFGLVNVFMMFIILALGLLLSLMIFTVEIVFSIKTF